MTYSNSDSMTTTPKGSRLDTILLGACTSLVVLVLTFVWNLKGDIAVLQDHDGDRKETILKINNIELKMNEVQLNLVDIKDRVGRIENNQKK